MAKKMMKKQNGLLLIDFILSYIHKNETAPKADNQLLNSIFDKPGPDFESIRDEKLKARG